MAEKKEKKEKKVSKSESIEEGILGDIKFIDMVSKLPWNSSGSKWGKRRIDDINKIIIHQSLSDGKLENINAYNLKLNLL